MEAIVKAKTFCTLHGFISLNVDGTINTGCLNILSEVEVTHVHISSFIAREAWQHAILCKIVLLGWSMLCWSPDYEQSVDQGKA